ncbi:Peptidase and NfeD-like domain-containing protein [Desulfonema magnum]|uniref:Peptidase and NfeD-like domain-containing protein n=1 Tax=Desulfonema magnum TaxID=45655 RepID=A0A975GM39_9BACT|nr:Peptidase and NfeD-like domain-containing protein [Desulfonema magnum]
MTLLWACTGCGAVSASDSGQTPVRHVVVIPVAGEVGPAMAAFIERTLDQGAEQYDNALYVLEMDTFGGRVDSAFQIVETLLNKPRGKTIAYVKKKAISAGALIALACNELTMKHSTTIGDCAPIIFSNEGPKMLGEKFQSPLRAKFRTLAKRNGYPETLAESMVSSDMTVFRIEMDDGRILYIDSVEYEDFSEKEREQIRSKKTVVGKGKLLTMDDQEALEFGFSKMSVESVEEMLEKKNITNYQMIRFEESWSEQLVRLITKIAPILMLLGFAGLYIEMQTPGFGVPGIVGITCLALVFLSQYMVGLANHTEFLIITIGIMLLGIEMFVIPGFGVIGIAGIALMAAGMILSLQDFVLPKVPWERKLFEKNIMTVLGSLFSAFVVIIFFFRYAFPKISQVIHGPYLSADLASSRIDSDNSVNISVGDSGVVIKPLRPSGSVKIGDEVFDMISEGEYIDKGASVVITEIRANRIVVTRSSANDL